MSEHDPFDHDDLCPCRTTLDPCACDALAAARADERLKVLAEYGLEERERIAQEIDRLADVAEIRWRNEQHVYWEGARDAHRDAARIARRWQTVDWPLLTEHVANGSVVGAAQAVTDWLRNGGNDA